ncbi:hypothetical protein ACFX10_019528 [Malus domestica]
MVDLLSSSLICSHLPPQRQIVQRVCSDYAMLVQLLCLGGEDLVEFVDVGYEFGASELLLVDNFHGDFLAREDFTGTVNFGEIKIAEKLKLSTTWQRQLVIHSFATARSATVVLSGRVMWPCSEARLHPYKFPSPSSKFIQKKL